MRKFYIQYYSDFANTYNLCYTDSREEDAQAIACGMERISRKEAENKCKDEKLRRMYSPSFAYNADSVILPFGYDGDWLNDRRMRKVGYIIERVEG